MTEENWVKLPEPAPKSLPAGTWMRCGHNSCAYRATEIVILDHSRQDRYWSDWEVPALNKVYENEWLGFIGGDVRLPPGYHFSGSEVVKEGTVGTDGIDHAAPGSDEAGALQAQQRALEKLAANPNAISNQFSPGYPQTKKPACSCGSTENTRRAGGVRICAACYQQQRRAERAAQKLDQAKRDLDRPVKRDPYEWLGFSSPTWEE